MSRSQIFVLMCVAFISGIAAGSFIEIPFFSALIFFSLVAVLVVTFWRFSHFRIALFALLFAVAGALRVNAALDRATVPESISLWNGARVFLKGSVREIDVRPDQVKVTIDPLSVTRSGHEKGVKPNETIREYGGYVLATLPQGARVDVEDILRIECMLEEPGRINDFDYGAYLRMFEVYSVCYHPMAFDVVQEAETRALGIGGDIRVMLADARSRVKMIINESVPYPSSALLAAIVFGMRREVPDELMQDFARTSVTHIIAVSGSHISVIVALVWTWLVGMGIRRTWAFWSTVIFIVIFLAVIGFIPSAVRAGIMGMLMLIAQYLGRPRHSANALVCAGAVMLFFNPLLARWDVGFQLSFLAVLGIIYLEPHMMRWCEKLRIPELSFLQVRSTLVVSLSAQVFVLPWTLYYFQMFSAAGPIANLLVLPLANAALLAGLLLVIVGLVHMTAASFVGWWAHLLASGFIMVVQFFARLPWAAYEVEKIPFAAVVVAYAALAGIIWKLNRPRSFPETAPAADDDIDQMTVAIDERGNML